MSQANNACKFHIKRRYRTAPCECSCPCEEPLDLHSRCCGSQGDNLANVCKCCPYDNHHHENLKTATMHSNNIHKPLKKVCCANASLQICSCQTDDEKEKEKEKENKTCLTGLKYTHRTQQSNLSSQKTNDKETGNVEVKKKPEKKVTIQKTNADCKLGDETQNWCTNHCMGAQFCHHLLNKPPGGNTYLNSSPRTCMHAHNHGFHGANYHSSHFRTQHCLNNIQNSSNLKQHRHYRHPHAKEDYSQGEKQYNEAAHYVMCGCKCAHNNQCYDPMTTCQYQYPNEQHLLTSHNYSESNKTSDRSTVANQYGLDLSKIESILKRTEMFKTPQKSSKQPRFKSGYTLSPKINTSTESNEDIQKMTDIAEETSKEETSETPKEEKNEESPQTPSKSDSVQAKTVAIRTRRMAYNHTAIWKPVYNNNSKMK